MVHRLLLFVLTKDCFFASFLCFFFSILLFDLFIHNTNTKIICVGIYLSLSLSAKQSTLLALSLLYYFFGLFSNFFFFLFIFLIILHVFHLLFYDVNVMLGLEDNIYNFFHVFFIVVVSVCLTQLHIFVLLQRLVFLIYHFL